MKRLMIVAVALTIVSPAASAAPLPVKKTGTIDICTMETSPILLRGRPWLMEHIREDMASRAPTYPAGVSYVRFRDLTDMRTFSPSACHGIYMASAYVFKDRVYVTGVLPKKDIGEVWMWESDDLVNWSEPRRILGGKGWRCFNTSICRADDRFVMVVELGEPAELVGEPFTMFFAESRDLREWKLVEGAVFGRDIYTGSPLLRHHGDWFYFFYLGDREPVGGSYKMRVARSRDLRKWEISPDRVLSYGPEDRLIHPDVFLTTQDREYVAGAPDCNASDLDMFEYGGKLRLFYAWGNQQKYCALATAEVNGTERAFCESFFPSASSLP